MLQPPFGVCSPRSGSWEESTFQNNQTVDQGCWMFLAKGSGSLGFHNFFITTIQGNINTSSLLLWVNVFTGAIFPFRIFRFLYLQRSSFHGLYMLFASEQLATELVRTGLSQQGYQIGFFEAKFQKSGFFKICLASQHSFAFLAFS